MRQTWLIALVALLAMTSCRPRVPGGVLSRSKMEDVLYDYHLAQGMAEQSDSVDKNRLAYTQAVFNKHRITSDQFDSSMVWYCAHSYELQAIYDHIAARYEVQSASAAEQDEFSNINGDTVLLHLPQQLYSVLPTPQQCLARIEVPVDSAAAMRAHQCMLRFNANFICANGSRAALVALQVRNRKGTVRAETRTVRADGRQELRVQFTPSDSISCVNVYVYTNPNEHTGNFAAFVADRMLLVCLP